MTVNILGGMFSLAQNYLTRGFWGDEAWTSLISQLPYLSMLKTTAADFHPPAYYTIVELIYKFLPATEVVTRSVSTFFYLATAIFVFKLAGLWRGRLFGLTCAILTLVNPIFFRYAFEARNYTMFAFLATGFIYFLLKLSEKFDKKSAILFVVFSLLGIYTHYYMFFVLAAQGIWLLLLERKMLLKMTGLFALVGLFYLPWIPFLIKQVSTVGTSYWISAIGDKTHFEAVLRILAGEEQSVFRTSLFWLGVILVIWGFMAKIIKRNYDKVYLLLFLWILGSIIMATLPGLEVGETTLPFRPIFFWRYLIPLAIPLSILVVDGAKNLPGNLFKTAIIATFGLSMIIDMATFKSSPYSFREAYYEKLPEIKPSDKIVTVLPSFAEVLYFRNQLQLSNELIVLPEGLVQFSGKSLLDAYVNLKVVRIDQKPKGRYVDATESRRVVIRE